MKTWTVGIDSVGNIRDVFQTLSDKFKKAIYLLLKIRLKKLPYRYKIQVRYYDYSNLDPKVKREYERIYCNAFGFTLDDYEHDWSQPNCLILGFLYGQLVAGYYIVDRTVVINGTKFSICGLGGLVCNQQLRNLGLTTELITQTWSSYCKEHGANIGLLICSDKNVPFYKRIGWETLNCVLDYEPTTASETFKFNLMALNNLRIPTEDIKSINVLGRLW